MEKQSIRSKAAIVTNNGSDLHGGHSGSYDSYYDSYFDSIPPGYRFKPLDEELVVFYLKRKLENQRLPPNRINDVQLYKFNPDTLAEIYEADGEDEMWYFFTPREKKYPNGTRPNRAAGDGYWKATGADKDVKSDGVKVGCKTSLVFYRGKPPHGDKTDWKMHEYKVNHPPMRTEGNDMRLDDWVLCRIYKNLSKLKTSNQLRDDGVQIQEQKNDGNSLDNGPVFDEADHSPANPDQQTFLLSNQNGYYSSDRSEILNCTNDTGYDGAFGLEPLSSLLPFQNPEPFNGYQHCHRFRDLQSEFDHTNYDQWLIDTTNDVPTNLP